MQIRAKRACFVVNYCKSLNINLKSKFLTKYLTEKIELTRLQNILIYI